MTRAATTTPDIATVAARMARESAEAQGLPATVEDEGVLTRLAVLLSEVQAPARRRGRQPAGPRERQEVRDGEPARR